MEMVNFLMRTGNSLVLEVQDFNGLLEMNLALGILIFLSCYIQTGVSGMILTSQKITAVSRTARILINFLTGHLRIRKTIMQGFFQVTVALILVCTEMLLTLD